MDVNYMADGKTYYNNFYIYFAGLKQDQRKSYRRVINLDRYFLKGLYSRE